MDQLAAHFGGDRSAGHGVVARDIAHGDRRADAGRETARGHDADLVLAVEQLGAFAHRQLAVDGEADALAGRAVLEMAEDARRAGEILLRAAALADREADRKSTRLNSSH